LARYVFIYKNQIQTPPVPSTQADKLDIRIRELVAKKGNRERREGNSPEQEEVALFYLDPARRPAPKVGLDGSTFAPSADHVSNG